MTSPDRLAGLFRALRAEEGVLGTAAQTERRGGSFAEWSGAWRDQTGGGDITRIAARNRREMQGYVEQAQTFRETTGVGLAWAVQQQRDLRGVAKHYRDFWMPEPEFITLQDIPVADAAGFVAGGAPRLFVGSERDFRLVDTVSREVRARDLGGVEPGSFVDDMRNNIVDNTVGSVKLDLHSGQGRLTSDHIWRFLSPADRRDLGYSRSEFGALSVSVAANIANAAYPDSESIGQLLYRAAAVEDVYFRAMPNEASLFGHDSADLALTVRVQSEAGRGHLFEAGGYDVDPDELLPFPADAYVRETAKGPIAYREGVFASRGPMGARGYLLQDGLSSLEGGDSLSIFRGRLSNDLGSGLHFNVEQLGFTDEVVVKPLEELYRIDADIFDKKYERIEGSYKYKFFGVDFVDTPAELFAVNPRRRYLSEKRPLKLHSGGRYLSEHMLRPDYFKSALYRGTLNPKFTWEKALFFSEGAHFRGTGAGYGFLFDPKQLERDYDAVVSPIRMSRIFDALGDSEVELGVGGRVSGTALADYWERRTGVSVKDFWEWQDRPAMLRRFVGEAQWLGEDAGIGLEWWLGQQRRLREGGEPEYLTMREVPLSVAKGYIGAGALSLLTEPIEKGVPINRWQTRLVRPDEVGGTEPGSYAKVFGNVGSIKLDLHSGRERIPDPFQLSKRLVSHGTSAFNYDEILETGAVLSPKRLDETAAMYDSQGMYEIDRYAGDDEFIFLGPYTSWSMYGDYGLVFPLERLVEKYDARVSDVDLYETYGLVEASLALDWAEGNRFPQTFRESQSPFSIRDFRKEFRERAQVVQEDYRREGSEALRLFDEKEYVETLVPDMLPISEAVAVVERNKPRLIVPETRGADPDRWEFDQFPMRLNLHGNRRKLYHTTPMWNRDSILQEGLDPGRSTGKRREVYLHTPSRQKWAVEHMMKKYNLGSEDIAVFEVDVSRKDLTRRWRGIWSTPKKIEDVRLVDLHGGVFEPRIGNNPYLFPPVMTTRPTLNQDRDSDIQVKPKGIGLTDEAQLRPLVERVMPVEADDDPDDISELVDKVLAELAQRGRSLY